MREFYRGMGIDHVVIPEYFVVALFGDKKWLLGTLAHQEPRIMRRCMAAYWDHVVVVVGLVLAVILQEAQAVMYKVRGSNIIS
jgi:hypothetical protein